jgi:hypothetical protein
MDKLDFLNGPSPDEPAVSDADPAPEAEPSAPAAPEPPQDGPARGPDGKFAPKDAAPAPQEAQAPATPPEAPPAAPAEPVVPPGFVPVAALQELRKEMQALRQQQAAPPPVPPDPYEDPEGYTAHQEDQRIAINAQWSQRLAVATHGEDAVNRAQQWAADRFERDPVFRQQSLAHPDPFGFAIVEHQREQALQMFTDPKTLESFRAWQAAQMGQPPAAQQPAPAPSPGVPQPTAPPPSIASAPSAGGVQHVPSGPGQAFSAVIP